MRVSLSQSRLDEAVAAGVLDAQRADALWAFLTQAPGEQETPRFKMAHLLYYFGGLKLQMTASAEAACPLLLAYASGRRELPPVSATRELVWQTERGRGRLRELFALYRKADAAAP